MALFCSNRYLFYVRFLLQYSDKLLSYTFDQHMLSEPLVPTTPLPVAIPIEHLHGISNLFNSSVIEKAVNIALAALS